VAYPFLQASHYTPAGGRAVDLVVIHTMEAPEKRTTAEDVARWFQTTHREVSAHYCIDNDSIVQCVREEDVAWCAPGANHNGVHLEHAGYARQTAAQWADAYSQAMLERSSGLAAEVLIRHRIPATWLYPPDLLAGRRGITSHANVSRAFRRSDHTDPGAHFPIEAYVTLVRGHTDAEPADTVALQPAPPTLARGSTGWQVTRMQRLLVAHGFLPGDDAADGDFGPITEAAVREFQRRAGLEHDGIVGPLTWHALLASTVRARRGRAASRDGVAV
jgi:N-acetyl-anhydromuramyl-L-alanine amidase AmpD